MRAIAVFMTMTLVWSAPASCLAVDEPAASQTATPRFPTRVTAQWDNVKALRPGTTIGVVASGAGMKCGGPLSTRTMKG